MPTKQEAVILALLDALSGHTAQVMREEELPQECPPEGLINVIDEDPVEDGFQLGAGVREWRRRVELELVVYSEDRDALPNLLDSAAIRAVDLLRAADFAGLITHVHFGAAEGADDIPMADAVYLRGATVPVTLFYETSDNPMEKHT
ncbi:hypothetical protein [Leisingera caerulea]|uniref:hypothetical protein n=1 Tax=Leisingera caerulea TaxID=506591 RepID=UPI003F4AAA19